jgi:transcription elongation factor Elf1
MFEQLIEEINFIADVVKKFQNELQVTEENLKAVQGKLQKLKRQKQPLNIFPTEVSTFECPKCGSLNINSVLDQKLRDPKITQVELKCSICRASTVIAKNVITYGKKTKKSVKK